MAKIALDFTNVKESSGFNPKHMPEADYVATITKAEIGKSKSSGKQQIVLGVQLNDHRTAVYPYYCGTETDQLWKIRNVLIAAGVSVPKKKINVDTDKLIGKEIGISLEDDEYEGKMKSVIMGVFPASDVDEGLPVDEDEEIEEEEEEEEEAPAPKARARKAAPAPVEEEDGDEAEEDDEEEEEEAPKPVSKRTAARRAAKAAAKAEPEDDEEDDDLDLDEL